MKHTMQKATKTPKGLLRLLLQGCTMLVVAIASLSPSFAQATGTIVGTVADTTGAVIPGARITVTNVGNKLTRTAVTGRKGATR